MLQKNFSQKLGENLFYFFEIDGEVYYLKTSFNQKDNRTYLKKMSLNNIKDLNLSTNA